MSQDAGSRSEGRYVLGHSDSELGRLQLQARLIGPITRRFFSNAGVTEGMRVLDVGCGAGDVSFLVSSLVGYSGEVVGIDRSTVAIQLATERAAEYGLYNVRFVVGDAFAEPIPDRFDAAIGLYVLQFQPDPVAALRSLRAAVEPGGLLAFHEIDWGGVESSPSVPTFDRVCGWLRAAITAGGAATRMGIGLYHAFIAAGLPVKGVARDALFGGGADGYAVFELAATLALTLAAQIEQLGLTSEIDADDLLAAMVREATDLGAFVVGNTQYCVWARNQ